MLRVVIFINTRNRTFESPKTWFVRVATRSSLPGHLSRPMPKLQDRFAIREAPYHATKALQRCSCLLVFAQDKGGYLSGTTWLSTPGHGEGFYRTRVPWTPWKERWRRTSVQSRRRQRDSAAGEGPARRFADKRRYIVASLLPFRLSALLEAPKALLHG